MQTTRFEAFIVVRADAHYIEIHTVGASGSALDELMKRVEEIANDTLVNLGSQNAGTCDDGAVALIGQHPDAPTGVRITGIEIDDRVFVREAFAEALRDDLDDVMEAF